MKRIFNLLMLLVAIVALTTGCKPNEPDGPKPPKKEENPHQYVNDWIFKEMNVYYLWNEKIPKSPDYTLDPKAFFSSLLYKFDKTTNPNGDRFSWIQENYVDLLNSLSGVKADEIGFEFVRVGVGKTDQYYLLVLYPKRGSDAEAKGIKKGRFVIKIDGQDITKTNISTLTGGTGSKTLTMADWFFDEAENKYKLGISGDVTVQMHKDFAENPVYLDSVYTTANNTKVGYLVYNFFAGDKGDGTRSYDVKMLNTLKKMKNEGGMTELILDLRYNGGGALSSAIALASALKPNRSSSEIFSYARYNDLVQSSLEQKYGSDFATDYFIDNLKDSKGTVLAEIPSLGLQKLYVITSQWTASASEMIINGLRPYLEIVIVGETTVGKNVGSVSFYKENDPNNKWGMQPIIAKFYNSKGESDYTAGFVPQHEVHELDNNLMLVEFGDIKDKMLNKALNVIDPSMSQVPQARAPRFDSKVRMSVTKSASMLENPTKTTLNDDVRGKAFREMMK